MKVDVIIPVRNGDRYILSALSSVLNQKHLGKLIVVDDFSTDNTAKLVLEYKERFTDLVLLQPNCHIGLSAARNLGVKAATAECIAFLDVDDTWEASKIDLHVKHFAEHDECKISFSSAKSIEELSGRVSIQPSNCSISGDIRNLVTQKFKVTGSASSVVMKTQLFQELGGFDESMQYAEDIDLWLRASLIQNLCEIPQVLVNILIRQDSMQRKSRHGLDRLKDSNARFRQLQIYRNYLKVGELRDAILANIWVALRLHFFHLHTLYRSEISAVQNFSELFKDAQLPNKVVRLNLKAVLWRLKGSRNDRG